MGAALLVLVLALEARAALPGVLILVKEHEPLRDRLRAHTITCTHKAPMRGINQALDGVEDVAHVDEAPDLLVCLFLE